ncbi:MAG: glycosyl transferase, partial [Rubripirellula sp.]|nr:glycosyl transferase [Rubripirellula sp.]
FSIEEKNAGLMRMAIDILTTIYRTLASQGVLLSDATFTSLRASYRRMAQDCIRQYAADAVINDLSFDRHVEEISIDAFADCITTASEIFRADPKGVEAIPNWTRVRAAFPEFTNRLREST